MDFHESATGKTAFIKKERSSSTSVFVLTGHHSPMDYPVANWVDGICHEETLSCLRWAYYGWDHSRSPHVPEGGRGYIRKWLSQALDIFDNVAIGSQVIVGHSMGGYLALALAMLRPERTCGLICLSPGFGKNLRQQVQELYGSCDVLDTTGAGFSVNLSDNGIMTPETPLAIPCPVRILQSMADDIAPWQNALAIGESISSQDVMTTLCKSAPDGHNLQKPSDTNWLRHALRELTS